MCNLTFDTEHLPDDPNELKAIIVALLESGALDKKTIDELLAEVSRLNLRIEQLLEMIFGKKSEKGVAKNLDHLNDSSEEKSNDNPKEEPNTEIPSQGDDTAESQQSPETQEKPAPEIPKRASAMQALVLPHR